MKGANYSCRTSRSGSVVLVEQAAELVAALDLARGRERGLRRIGRLQVERAVRPLAVVVVGVDANDVPEVAAVQDQQPVETLGADRSDEPLSDRVRLGARTGVFRIRMSSLRKPSSKGPLYLLSRSRISNRKP